MNKVPTISMDTLQSVLDLVLSVQDRSQIGSLSVDGVCGAAHIPVAPGNRSDLSNYHPISYLASSC